MLLMPFNCAILHYLINILMCFWVLTFISFTGVRYLINKIQWVMHTGFLSPSVKGTNTFLRVWGDIDRFYKLQRNIYWGWKMWHMSLWVTYAFGLPLKGNLQHYSYIFRDTKPLWKELKNTACSRLGTRL